MVYVYKSRFAESIQDFIRQKRVLGYCYTDKEKIMNNFDVFCHEKFPSETILTKDLCHAWVYDSKYKNGNRGRISPIREFAKYLISIGKEAYITPMELKVEHPRRLPHIYTEAEIASLWQVFDKSVPRKSYPFRHLVIPAIYRILYCCGLRPCEARRLNVADVDLKNGKIHILESKGHKSRIVIMSDDVTAYMRKYNEKLSRIIHSREAFFPGPKGKICTKTWLNREFNIAKEKAAIKQFGDNIPRVYDFRHTFATHRLYQWMRAGEDMDAKLPYLSAYMGHISITSTFYYIHLVPSIFSEMSGVDYSALEKLIPSVEVAV